ncbi:MAG TPA: AAC(3) family N-acetyltransferase [Armatimonadota bacterium]|jgi:aminoglycoside 3-N-acetyltransferase
MQSKQTVPLERLITDLRNLGIMPGDSVLTHASLSRIGYVEGGAETVVRALVEAVGPQGTALFPAHTGHPGISPEHPPVFDVRTSPTLNIGAVPEAARQFRGALRSLQPTHSVTAIGARAAWFTDGHEFCATPCGPGSPYDKLCTAGGKILLLGCDHESNTSIHMVEELADVPYHMLPGSGMMRITDSEGQVHELPGRFHRWGEQRDFMRLDGEMTECGIQRIGTVGDAVCRLVNAAEMRDLMLERLRADAGILLPARSSNAEALLPGS